MDERESFEGVKQRISELESEVDEIKARNEHLEKILSSLDTGLSVINSDLTISWANQKIRDMFPDGEPIGRICHRFYESSDEPCEPCPTLQCFKSGHVKSIERYNPTRESWYSIIAQPAKDSEGQVVSVLEGITDITEYKQAEQKLLQEKKLLNQITDKMFDMVSLTDLEGTYTFAGKSHERILGYTTEELIGKNVLDFVHPDDLPGITEKFTNFLQTGGIEKVQYRYKHKENHYLWFETIGKLLKDENHIPVEIIFSTRDITEQKLAENQLKETRAMFQAAMDHSQAGIAIARAPGGELLYVNESALNIRGANKEKIVNGIGIDQYVSSWQILHFDGTPYKSEEVPLTRAVLFGEFCTEEFLVKRPDQQDRIVWANAAPIKNDRGEIIYGIVVFLDVTERKKAELENTVSRMRLDISHRIATMPDATEKDISDFVLEKMLELSGSDIGFIGYVSPDEKEMIIHNWSNSAMAECAVHEKPITFPIDQAGIWGEAIRTREPVIINDYNEYHPSKNGYPEGHVRISRFMAVPVFDGERIVAVSAVGNKPAAYQEHDPRQLMILMESWWKQIQKLRWEKDRQTLQAKMSQAQKMESIGSLAGGIAHDFNNILFPIIGYSQLIIDDFDPGSPEHDSLKAIMDAGERGRNLVRQILAIGRQSEQQPIPVQIQTVLKEVLKLIRSTIPANIHITKDIQKDCGALQADPTQLHQIAMNLITNASHALEDDTGEIAVELTEVALGAEDFISENMEPGRYAVLTVSDTGSGISPDIMDKLFDPYFTTKEQGKGTGLGLSVVHGIVKGYGGDIKVYSELGKGTSFHVYLPVINQTAEVEKTENNRPLPTGDERILVVDDEAPIIQLEEALLKKLGYEVSSRTGSIDALEKFKQDPYAFDLVLTDMSMPNMTGEKLAREMIAIRPDIPVILCTGFSERLDDKKAEDIGVKDFLMKPIVNRDIAETVRKVLDEAKI